MMKPLQIPPRPPGERPAAKPPGEGEAPNSAARIIALAITTLLGVRPAAAESLTLGTPDGRATVTVSGEGSTSGGQLGAAGTIGAYSFDNTIEGGPGRFNLKNPPFYTSHGSAGAEYEETYGPRVANTTIGTGGLTAGLDTQGRLTVLGWPGPGMYDHVDFVTVTRRYPNQGAAENAGSFGGYGNSWIQAGRGWTPVSQDYATDDGQTLVTLIENPALDLAVTITDVVDPDEDLLARNFCFRSRSAPGACLTSGPFAYYANMNPTTARAPRVPSITDAALDDVSDFATVYDAAAAVMLHFRPYRIDPAAASMLATGQPGADTALRAVSGSFGDGVYIAIGGRGEPAGFQAGLDSGGLVRGEAEGTPLLDPYYDLLDDGTLSRSVAAVGNTAGALSGLPADPDDSYTVYLAAAGDPRDAIGIVDRARAGGFAAVRADAEGDWHGWISRARLPATDDVETLRVAKRALMLIRTAQDRATGAIVANATTQTPYRQDWVRDGAFFNYALLLAGYREEAVRHSDFYRRVYRPGGTWDSFYYPDGAEASFVFPYEIDSQAFALWALWLPYEFDPEDGGYLARVYPAIRDTADALLLCRDPTNGLQCRAAEDDAVVPTQMQQGASTVYLALRSAAAAALGVGDGGAAARWNARADELRASALQRLCNATRCGGGRGGVYMVWPSRLVDPASPLAQSHLQQYVTDLDAWASFASPPTGGCPQCYFQYPMEPLLALGPFWNLADPGRATKLEGWVEWLTHDVVEPGVRHYGERIFHCGGQAPFCDQDGREYLHTIGFPHIWSGTEMYLAAAFARGITGCPAGVEKIGEAVCR
jgi:hypothetical protein